MAKKGGNINYEEVINRQHKRITELRNDLAYYESQLHHLRHRASDNHPASLAATKSALASATDAPIRKAQRSSQDYSRVHESYMCALLTPNHNAVPRGGATATRTVPPHALRKSENVESGKPRRRSSSSTQRESKNTGAKTRSNELEGSSAQNSRYWTEREHNLFLYATKTYGPKNYSAISQFVQTRTPKQVRNHAQKYRLRLEREAKVAQRQVAGSAMWSREELTERGKGMSEKRMDRDAQQGKTGTKRSGKNLLRDLSPDNCVNTKEGSSGPGDLTCYDEFMKMISETPENASVKKPKNFGEEHELDLDFLDDCMNVKPKGS